MYDYGRFRKIIMETLVISPNFTIEDIHKVRENCVVNCVVKNIEKGESA